MSRELLQQALGALEWYAECSVVAGKASDAANAIRAALAAPQGEPFGYVTQYAMKWDWKSEMVLKVTRKAQAEYGFTVPLYAAQPAAPSVGQLTDALALSEREVFRLMRENAKLRGLAEPPK